MSTFPSEILELIFLNLNNLKDVFKLRQISQKFKKIVEKAGWYFDEENNFKKLHSYFNPKITRKMLKN